MDWSILEGESHMMIADVLACMDYMDPAVRCPEKAIKLSHSLTHWCQIPTNLLVTNMVILPWQRPRNDTKNVRMWVPICVRVCTCLLYSIYQWLNARLWYLRCKHNGDMTINAKEVGRPVSFGWRNHGDIPSWRPLMWGVPSRHFSRWVALQAEWRLHWLHCQLSSVPSQPWRAKVVLCSTARDQCCCQRCLLLWTLIQSLWNEGRLH